MFAEDWIVDVMCTLPEDAVITDDKIQAFGDRHDEVVEVGCDADIIAVNHACYDDSCGGCD